MHRRAVRLSASSALDHERQRLVVDIDLFGGVLGQRAAVGDHGHDPFAGIAGRPDRERMALTLGVSSPFISGIGGGGEFVAGQHIMHARHRQRRGRVDRDDARGRMRRGHQRDMQHALGSRHRRRSGPGRRRSGDPREPGDWSRRSGMFGIGAHASDSSDRRGWRRAGARRRTQSPRRSGRSRCSGRYCRKSPRRYPRASARDCRASSACADQDHAPACNSRIAGRGSRRRRPGSG